MKTMTLLILGLGAAFAASALVGLMRFEFMGSGPEQRPAIELVTAATDLPAGHRLTLDDLKSVPVAAEDADDLAMRSTNTAVGRTLIVPMVRGQLLRPDDLAAPGTGAAIASQLEPDQRAITVTLRDVGSGVVLYPGAFVDVLATVEAEMGRNERPRTMTKTVLEARRILAVNDEVVGGRAMDANGRSTARRQLTVTLAVTPLQARQVALAREEGVIGIVLRPTDDDGSSSRSDEVVTTDSLLDIDRTPPDALRPVEDRPLVEQPIFAEPVAVVEEPVPGVWEVVVIRNGEAEEVHAFEEDSTTPRKVTRNTDASD
ncbi:MAG: Flp pilus assembly protein CpaB [Planctomycetaceae bacterium]|nr:Flp pilus assembly protein CpaB [Planctomycetaceae bacterium]